MFFQPFYSVLIKQKKKERRENAFIKGFLIIHIVLQLFLFVLVIKVQETAFKLVSKDFSSHTIFTDLIQLLMDSFPNALCLPTTIKTRTHTHKTKVFTD